MNPLNRYFTRIFVINRDARMDRWTECQAQFKMFGIENVERFSAHEGVIVDGRVNGNASCTASHRALMEVIAFHRIVRPLILEDDFLITRGDFMESLALSLAEVPDDYDFLYLGGHYGEAPIARHSPRVIRCGRMLTTSSYSVPWTIARQIAPYLCGIGPIDSLLGGFHRERRSYIIQPRLFIQRPSYSDLQEREMSNAACMLDPTHEAMV